MLLKIKEFAIYTWIFTYINNVMLGSQSNTPKELISLTFFGTIS